MNTPTAHRRVTTPAEVLKINNILEGLIQAAPETSTAAPPPIRHAQSLVMLKHGWGAKYIEPEELTGDRWKATFIDASEHVARAGIVAFFGNRGSGKTRMAAEIARAGRWPADEPAWNGHTKVCGRTALYIRAMDIFLNLRDCSKKGADRSEMDVLKSLSSAGLLVIDELQERGETEWENRVVSNLLDKRYAADRPTILIANLSREDLAKALSPSVRDRMQEQGKGFLFDWPSYRRDHAPRP
ncbi:ATP-binding protein [bacterium]|nr:ATP-binding protein [bacterium]